MSVLCQTLVVYVLQHEGHTALHLSSWEGDEAMVKFLHQVKANPNIVDEVGPVHNCWSICALYLMCFIYPVCFRC